MFVWLDIARCLYVKLLLLKDENKSSCMFVWLDIGRCLYVKLLLVIDLNEMQLYVCLARHCQMSISKAAPVEKWNKSSCMFV